MSNKLEFRIPNWASIEDVATWDCQSGDDLEFRIKRESAFELFATGAAISAVSRLRSKASNISIRCEFAFPSGAIDQLTTERWPNFFLTLGGVALLHAANRVVDAAGADLSTTAFDALWRQILLKSGGIIGDGKSQNLVSREFDSPIPEAVRSSESSRLPSRREFELVLGKLGSGLGAGKRFFGSVTEAAISGFLFEAFRNSIEHAIPESEGIWGVFVEKLLLNTGEDVSRRRQIPQFARSFVERQSRQGSVLWICATVADYGHGIQNTLPPTADESGWVRLLRAFERGTSRKPRSGSPNRGQGLPNILDAATRLGACILVNSTGLAAFNECSPKGSAWYQIAIPAGLRGTSISVFWPVGDESPDQERLKLGF
jgi:hypothetical protein